MPSVPWATPMKGISEALSLSRLTSSVASLTVSSLSASASSSAGEIAQPFAGNLNANNGDALCAAALAVFGAILLLAGKDPLKAYADTFSYTLANAYGFSELLVRMTPLLLTAVAVALPSRLGLINVGGEGQLYMGAWLASAGALLFPGLPAWILLPLVVVLGFLGGALWGAIPGILRAAKLVNETIAKTGENIQVRRFSRFQLGEGIEKKKEDLATEIAKMAEQK